MIFLEILEMFIKIIPIKIYQFLSFIIFSYLLILIIEEHHFCFRLVSFNNIR